MLYLVLDGEETIVVQGYYAHRSEVARKHGAIYFVLRSDYWLRAHLVVVTIEGARVVGCGIVKLTPTTREADAPGV